MYWLLMADNCKYVRGWLCGKMTFTYAPRWEDSVLIPERYSAFVAFCYYLYYRPKDSQLLAMACMTSMKRNNYQSFMRWAVVGTSNSHLSFGFCHAHSSGCVTVATFQGQEQIFLWTLLRLLKQGQSAKQSVFTQPILTPNRASVHTAHSYA